MLVLLNFQTSERRVSRSDGLQFARRNSMLFIEARYQWTMHTVIIVISIRMHSVNSFRRCCLHKVCNIYFVSYHIWCYFKNISFTHSLSVPRPRTECRRRLKNWCTKFYRLHLSTQLTRPALALVQEQDKRAGLQGKVGGAAVAEYKLSMHLTTLFSHVFRVRGLVYKLLLFQRALLFTALLL